MNRFKKVTTTINIVSLLLFVVMFGISAFAIPKSESETIIASVNISEATPDEINEFESTNSEQQETTQETESTTEETTFVNTTKPTKQKNTKSNKRKKKKTKPVNQPSTEKVEKNTYPSYVKPTQKYIPPKTLPATSPRTSPKTTSKPKTSSKQNKDKIFNGELIDW